MAEGRIVRSGDKELAIALERHGYTGLDQAHPHRANDGSTAEREPAGTP
jgi:Fe-S cluster assembly ATPase SufC